MEGSKVTSNSSKPKKNDNYIATMSRINIHMSLGVNSHCLIATGVQQIKVRPTATSDWQG